MRASVVLLLAVGACYNPTVHTGIPCGDNDACPSGQQCIAGICGGLGTGDAGPDSLVIDAPAGCETWQAKHFDACVLPAPYGDLHVTLALSDYNWDTSNTVLKAKAGVVIPVATQVMTQAGGPDVLIASVNNLTIDKDATLSIAGPRALLIAVWGTATIDGGIYGSASLTTAGPGGAAATSTALDCDSAPTGDSGAGGTPAKGGGGGGYQGNGGRGGDTGGLPGTTLAASLIIHGGCAGGLGGAGGATGTRGAGGGALQITSRMSITIDIDATIAMGGGAGGGGHHAYGGGGGGGAGGYIGFDAPALTIAGIVAANGGGGGGGASDVANGANGTNGRPDGIAASGGAGAGTSNVGACGRGGNGSFGGTLNGANGGSSSCGGGGGGGAAGYVLVWSPSLTVTGTASPPAITGP